jgi:hypothetical protein
MCYCLLTVSAAIVSGFSSLSNANCTLYFCVCTDLLPTVPSSGVHDDFFDFDSADDDQLIQDTIDKECVNYLSDTDTSLNILRKYSTVLHVFHKYNTTMPSSASVERLFSSASQTETPRRNCLSDSSFQKLLLLKSNASFYH